LLVVDYTVGKDTMFSESAFDEKCYDLTPISELRMNRSILQRIAGLVVIAVACWNVWTLTLRVSTFGSRENNSNVVFERLWGPFFNEFVKADYRIGDVGYITARTLRGEQPTNDDKIRRVNFYYAAIPLNVVPDKLDAPFVIADFAMGAPPDQLPQGFDKLYDGGNGLMLLKRRAAK
jgi:hypothetical protein